jgi:hypothetical protein
MTTYPGFRGPAGSAEAEGRGWGGGRGYGRPLPFQFQIPLGGGPLGLAVPLGGYGSPFAFTVPLGPTPTAVPAAAPAIPATTPATDAPALPPPVKVAEFGADQSWVLDAAEAWGDTEGDARSTGDFVESLLAGLSDEPAGAGPPLRPPRAGALALFNATAWPSHPLWGRLGDRIEVLARPGGPIGELVPVSGDLLIRVARGEGWGSIAVVATPGRHRHEELAPLGLRFEGYPRLEPGFYVHVVEPGRRFRAVADRFCRRIADAAGCLRADTALLRIRRPPVALAREAADLGEAGSSYPCGGELSAFGQDGRAANLSAGRRSRPQYLGGRPLCRGEADLVLAAPGDSVDLLIWNFDIDGSYTKAAHEAALDRLISEVHTRLRGPAPSATSFTIHLSGFASRTGNAEYNAALATEREATVEAYLRANIEKFAAASEAPIGPAVTYARNPGGFDPAAPPGAETAHARSARVIAAPAGTPPPPPRPFPTPIPQELKALLEIVARVLNALPLGRLGVVAPTNARFLTAAEQSEAMTVFAGSLDFTKIVITDGLGFQGRPFTVAAPTAIGWFVALNQGPGAIARDWSLAPQNATLIHELTHGWQSQHATDRTAFMANSIRSQALAVAQTQAERASAYARAFAAWQFGHPFDVSGADAAGRAAAAGICLDPYAYVRGRPFTDYAAEQAAQITEDAYVGGSLATDPVVAHLRGLAANVTDPDNDTSLATARIERRGAPSVVSPSGPCPGAP